MDELAKSFLTLGINGAELLVFLLIIFRLMADQKEDRTAFASTVRDLAKDFKEEQEAARENCRKESEELREVFEKNLQDIRREWVRGKAH